MSTAPPRPPDPPQAPLTLFQRMLAAPVTVSLMIINIGVFALAESQGSTTNTATLMRFGANNRHAVWDGEVWRLFTAMFLHIGPIHLFWNSLFGFGMNSRMEGLLGKARFLALYLGAGIAGSALSVIGHDVVSAGASGALFGVIGAELVMIWVVLGGPAAMWADRPTQQHLISTASWFAIGAFMGFDNYAHLGGLLFGALVAAVSLQKGRARLVGAVLALVTLVLLVAAASAPLPFIHEDDGNLRKAETALAKKDYAGVLALTDGAKSAKSERALYVRAFSLNALNRFEEAKAVADRLLTLFPQNASGYFARAHSHMQLKEYQAAIDDCDRATRSSDDDAWCSSVRASAYQLLSQPEKALENAEEAVKLKPKGLAEQLALAWLLVEQGQHERALQVVDRVIASHPSEEGALASRVELLADLGRDAETRKALEALKQAHPESAELPALLCRVSPETADHCPR